MLKIKNNKIVQSLRRIRIWVLVLAAVAALPAMAFADEVWKSSQVGEIIWEKDVGSTAVFLYATPGFPNAKTRLFINNFTSDTQGERGSYSGYWIDNSNRATCEASLVDRLGTSSRSWGRFEITFEKNEKAFWNWTGRLGNCFAEPSWTIDAKSDMGPNESPSGVLSGTGQNKPTTAVNNMSPVAELSLGNLTVALTVTKDSRR